MRYLQRRGGLWLVIGPQGGIVMEYQKYSDAQYHVMYGHRPPPSLDTASHLASLARKRWKLMKA